MPPMTQEELMQMIAMQQNPMARATNDYGQGAGFLGLDEQPESWDRMGEVNDLYSDFFRTTQSYLKDYVPGLYQEYEKPDGYTSDSAMLYAGNPAYSAVEELVKAGTPFDQAVRAASTDPELAQYMPVNTEGKTDPIAFRQSAEGYLKEAAKSGRANDEMAAYDDFVRARSAWDEAPGVEDISGYMKPITETPRRAVVPMPMPRGRGEDVRADMPGVNRNEYNEFYGPNSPNVAPPAPAVAAPAARRGSGNVMRNAIEERNRGANETVARGVREKNRNNAGYNAAMQKAYNTVRGQREAVATPSKQAQNRAKIAAAYNMLMYGE